MRLLIVIWLSWTAWSANAQMDSVYLDAVEIKRYTRIDSTSGFKITDMNVGGSAEDPVHALRYYSPSFLKRFGSDGFVTISLDGMNPRHTATFWNGIPVNKTLTGVSDLSIFLHARDLEISLPRGSHTMAHSAAQLGGMLWLESAYTVEDAIDLSMSFGSFLRRTADLNANLHLDSADVTIRFKAGYHTSGNDYTFYNYNSNPITIDQMNYAAFKRWHTESGFDWIIDQRHRLTANVLVHQTDREIPPAVVSPNNRGNQDEMGMRMAWRLRSDWTSWQQDLHIGYNYDNLGYNEFAGEQEVIRTDHKVHQVSLQNQWVRVWKDHRLSWSGNLTSDHIRGSGLSKRTVLSGGVAGLWSGIFWQKRLAIQTAFRMDIHQDLRAIPSGQADLQVQPGGRSPLTFFTTVGHFVKYPSVTDLYLEPSGNVDLLAERSWKISGGFKLKLNKGGFSLVHQSSAYRSWLTDMILWVPTNKQYWQPINLKSVRAYGLQSNIGWSWEGEEQIPRFALHTLYQWAVTTNGANVDGAENLFPNDITIGKQLPYIPKHQFKVNPMIGYYGMYMRWSMQYVSARFVTGSNSYFLEPYWMAEARFGYEHEFGLFAFDLQFRIHNVFNNEYYQEVAHIPMPFRHYSFQLTLGAKRS